MFNLHKSKIYTFYITLLLILTSGTALVGIVYYIPSLILLFISSLLLFRPVFHKSSLLWFLFISFVLIINFLVTSNDDYTSYLTALIKILSVFLIFNSINLKLLAKYFVYIMAVICFISLFFYGFGVLFPDYIRSTIPVVEAWGNPLRITPLYVYKFWEMNRNNGIWWEPGAFQIFINSAVYIVMKLDINKKHRRFINLIFFVTIITTFSTTGYVVYGLIILSRCSHWIKKINYVKLLFISYFLISILVVEELTHGAIINKFNEQNTSYQSFERRLYDFEMAIDQITRKPITGWGFGNSEMYSGYDYTDSSNGLLELGAEFGLFYLILFLGIVLFVINKFTNSRFETLIIFTCFIIITSTEDVLWFPLFIALFFIPGLFSFSTSKRLKPIKDII